MRTRTKLVSLSVVVVLVLMIGVSTIPQAQANPRFIISSWAYPDEYGQGIDAFTVYENSTGSWLQLDGVDPTVEPTDSTVFEWNVSLGIRLRLDTIYNNELVGADNITDGENYHRYNVTVTRFNGTVVFSQTNFTYFNSWADGSLYLYSYTVILDFVPLEGEVYTATVTYEVFY